MRALQPPHVRLSPTGRTCRQERAGEAQTSNFHRDDLEGDIRPDHRSAPTSRAARGAVLRPHRESAHPWPATPPRSRCDARPAEALAYTRMHPEVVGDPATSDRHRATPASVAIGSLHANKTPRGAGRGRMSQVPWNFGGGPMIIRRR